jgi:hypothetical protein
MKRITMLFLGLLLFAGILLLLMFLFIPSSMPQSQLCIGSRGQCVTYKATGSAWYQKVSYFVYAPFDDKTMYFRGVWQYTVEIPSGESAYVTVYNPTPFGTQSCEIWVNGMLVQSANAKDGYALTICDYTLP